MNYICTRELGHAILHTNTYIKLFIENKLHIKNKYEIEADKFAAEVLVDIEEDAYLYEGIPLPR